MSLSYNATEIKLILALFFKLQKKSEKESYLYRLAKEVNRTLPTTLENLEKLEHKGLIKSIPTGIPRGKRGPVRFYHLTEDGKFFAQFLAQQVLKRGFT